MYNSVLLCWNGLNALWNCNNILLPVFSMGLFLRSFLHKLHRLSQFLICISTIKMDFCFFPPQRKYKIKTCENWNNAALVWSVSNELFVSAPRTATTHPHRHCQHVEEDLGSSVGKRFRPDNKRVLKWHMDHQMEVSSYHGAPDKRLSLFLLFNFRRGEVRFRH